MDHRTRGRPYRRLADAHPPAPRKENPVWEFISAVLIAVLIAGMCFGCLYFATRIFI